MKAIEASKTAQGWILKLIEREIPKPKAGELLLKVLAVGVTPTELDWFPTTHQKDGTVRTRAVLGHEFSGIIAELGPDAGDFVVGEPVFGMNDWFEDGATAEYCLARPGSIARKPASLSHEEAATVPIAALTAWQGLMTHACVKPGERVLIHGGAGSVGSFAVQIAALQGAHVVTTATEESSEALKKYGASVIDYTRQKFEDNTGLFDVIVDTVGGETLSRSWSVLAAGGRLVTIAADVELSTDPRAKQAFFIVEPNGNELAMIGQMLQDGKLSTCVKAIARLEQASLAYTRKLPARHPCGKVVLTPA